MKNVEVLTGDDGVDVRVLESLELSTVTGSIEDGELEIVFARGGDLTKNAVSVGLYHDSDGQLRVVVSVPD